MLAGQLLCLPAHGSNRSAVIKIPLPDNQELIHSLGEKYQALLGNLVPRTLDSELVAKTDELLLKTDTPDWLLANDRRPSNIKQVKIAEGVTVLQKVIKKPGGLMRGSAVVEVNRLRKIHFSGGLFFYPAEKLVALETASDGVTTDELVINQVVSAFYEDHRIETPGITPMDFGEVFHE